MRLWGSLFGPVPAGETLGRVDRADAVVLAVFLVDYVVELALAGDRRSYVRHEWLSAIIVMTSGVALVPDLAVFGAARVLRGLPAARGIAALVRVLALGGTAARDVRGVIRRRALTFAVAVAALTWVTSASAFTLAEDVGVDGRVESFSDGLWWSAATITTVGYGDVAPITTAGRLVGLVTMVVGISTFAVLTARVAAFLVVEEPRERLGADEEPTD